MSPKLLRITLNSNQPEDLVQFYSALGFSFTKREVDKGSTSWQGNSQNMVMEVYGIQETFSRSIPAVQLSFAVQNLEKIVQKIKQLGCQVMMEPLETDRGWMSYLLDPDGRSIELWQDRN